MKKTLLLMTLGAFAAMPMMAQVEEDMTQYIANPSFDEDLTFQEDGATKQPIVKEYDWHRSIVLTAEDGSVYARGKGTRGDGASPAYNGFIGQIKGWEIVTNKPLSEPYTGDGMEWTYFGNVPYSLGEKAVPIADDGTTFLVVPEKPEEINGDDNIGAVYLRAGWGGSCVYKQEVKLPCAEYRLDYWVFNQNYEGSKNNTSVKNLCKVTCRRDEFIDEDGFNAEQWTKHSISFTPVDKFTIEFGFQSSGGSGSNPFIFIDGITLTKIGEADPAELLRSDLYYYTDEELATLPDSLIGAEGEYFDGLILQAEDLQKEYFYDGDDLAQLQESINKLKGLFETMVEAGNSARRLEAQYLKAMAVLDATDYPGKADFSAYCESVYKLLYQEGTAEAIAAAETEMTEALNKYYFSQPADLENPANYSFLVPSPWFCQESREPADNEMTSVAVAELTADDINVNGAWVNGSSASATAGGYLKVGRTCYQLWATNFAGYLDAHTELTNLPNGIYSVSMDMITNANALSDQHIYATSTLGQAEGYMTEAGVCYDWISDSNGYQGEYPLGGEDPWETVTTTQTVIVVDGKLTIGARSTHNGNCEDEDISDAQRRGSFWFTNVTLRYHGAATQEQIDAAIAARLQTAQDLAAAMHFAIDKAAVNDSIAAYNETKDFAVLNNGIALAETSEAKYNEIMEEGKTLPTIAANLESDPEGIYGVALDVVKFANDATLAWIASSGASYQQVDSILNVTKAYANTYAQAAIEASETAAEFRATARQAVNTAIASQKERLTTGHEMLEVAVVDELVAELKKLMSVASAQDAYERNPNATDYSGWIINPDFAEITGWDVIQGTGNGPLNQGQYYTGDADHKYFDSYNGTAGELNIYSEQVIEGLPNGTYTARVAARTSGEGAFLFAATGEAKADTIWKEIPMETYTYLDPVTEKDTTVNATDIYGSMWLEAFEKYNNGEADELESAIATCNGNNGRGWKWVTIEGIVVNDHRMTIGQTTDGTRSGKPFAGTWFSVVDWSLTLTAKGNNDGWNGPLTGVNSINAAQGAAADGIYAIDGRRVSNAARGLYIVVRNGKASKVIVK
ncbi:MAG: hypothetical protein J6I36_01710 [Bacteroidaceae bacterium]|nr:hypothetical protein [Bacteroidaceae bacterium]